MNTPDRQIVTEFGKSTACVYLYSNPVFLIATLCSLDSMLEHVCQCDPCTCMMQALLPRARIPGPQPGARSSWSGPLCAGDAWLC